MKHATKHQRLTHDIGSIAGYDLTAAADTLEEAARAVDRARVCRIDDADAAREAMDAITECVDAYDAPANLRSLDAILDAADSRDPDDVCSKLADYDTWRRLALEIECAHDVATVRALLRDLMEKMNVASPTLETALEGPC